MDPKSDCVVCPISCRTTDRLMMTEYELEQEAAARGGCVRVDTCLTFMWNLARNLVARSGLVYLFVLSVSGCCCLGCTCLIAWIVMVKQAADLLLCPALLTSQ